MTYTSKTDWWIVAAICLAILVFMMGDYWVAGPTLLILFLCAYPQTYVTTPEGLVIRTALGRQLIPYRVISFVGPGTERGAFAEAAERLRIRYGLASEILITPEDPDQFFADVAKRTPHLVKRGQRLVGVFA